MPGILFAHFVVFALLLLSPSHSVVETAHASPLNVFDVAAAERMPPPKSQPQPTPVPAPVIELKLETPLELPRLASDADAAEQPGLGTRCELADLLARAFAENPLLREQLARIGPEARSVANAIMFWDGQWVEVEGRAPADAVQLLRGAIVEGIRTAPSECLAHDVTGPRFIPVKEANGTMVLVLGSATWRWEQLLSEQMEMNKTDGDERLNPLFTWIGQAFQ